MRDYLLLLMMTGIVPLSLLRPYAGALAWAWLSLMNPHRLGWGLAEQFALNQVVGAVTLLGWLCSAEPKRLPNTAFTWLFLMFVAWTTVCTVISLSPSYSWPRWDIYIKAMLIVIPVLGLVTNQTRLMGLIWILVISLGYYGVKGGLFVFATGGSYQVMGPDSSMITDRNNLAVALVMILPLLVFLRRYAVRPWVRSALLFAIVFDAVAIIGTYSRGGFIALAATCFLLWLRSSKKMLSAMAVVIGLCVGVAFMPDKYMERIQTIENAKEDASFGARLEVWTFVIRAGLARPLTGVGVDAQKDLNVFRMYFPDAISAQSEDQPRAAHSIYFQVLGDQGFPGLVLFLGMLAASWLNARGAIRLARGRPELAWAGDLGRMCQASLLGFMVGGAALSLAYYDGFYLVCCIALITRRIAAAKAPATATMRHRGRQPLSAPVAA